MKKSTLRSLKNTVIKASLLTCVLLLSNQYFAQDCISIYGPTGEPSLGLNRTLCVSPGQINLDATAAGANSYVWSTASTNSSIQVTTAGAYSVTVGSGGNPNACVLNYTVTSVPNPVVSLGNDSTFCSGDTLAIYATPGFSTYNWTNGLANQDSILVNIADTYGVTVSDTNGCDGEAIIVVTEDTLPVPSLNLNYFKCAEDSISLDAGAGFVNYLWSDGQTTQIIDAANAGIYSVEVTDTNGCNGFDQTSVINLAPPAVNIGGDDTICIGASKVLNAGGGFTSYLWSDGTTFQTASFDSISDPWVIVTDTNGCEGSDTMHLEVVALPNINLGGNTNLCNGDTLVLDAGANMASYSWNNGVITQTLNVTTGGTYSVTIEDSNSCLNSDTIIVYNVANPNVNLGGDLDYCIGSTFNQLLDAGSGFVSYAWMDGTFTQIRNVNQNDDTVWVEVTDTNGCKGSDTVFVIENLLPVINLGPNDTICASQTYSLNAGNPGGAVVSYAWSTGSTNQTISIPADPTLVNDQTNNYSVTITDVNGCVNQDTIELHTYSLPVPVLGNDTAFCTGNPFNMQLNPGTFASYNWSTGASTPSINIGPIGTSYSVTVTDTRGCSNSDGLVVTENSLPTPNLGLDEAYCEGTGYSKILNPGGFTSYLWSDGSTGQVLGINTMGTFGVTVTDFNGCENSDEIIITENPAPPVDLGADVHYCEDVNLAHVLDATSQLPGPGFTFLWSTGQTSGTIIASAFGNYSVLVTDQSTGCFAGSQTNIVATQKAVPNLGSDGVVCAGQPIILDPNVSIGGYNYTWSTGATTATINVFETGVYWVQLDAANGTCTGLTDTVRFDPGVLPVVELGPDQYVCEGQTVKLLNPATAFPGATYEWQDGTKTPFYLAKETGTYEVEVRNECGAVVDQVYIEFQDCSNVWIPNSFTPNGDGKNEMFAPKTDQEFVEYGFWIYDRWGRLVFKTNQPNFGWDGKVNGEEAQPGVYVYRLSYVSSFQDYGTRVEKTGEFTLLR